MHILLTNDDGPPSPSSSPYLATFVRVLSSPPFNHTVSVVVPSQQRSWIGKAHLLPPSSFPIAGQKGNTKSSNDDVSDIVTPSYYDPVSGTTSPSPPAADGKEYWVTAPGTPATCVQLALFHHPLLFPHLHPNGTTETHTNGVENGASPTSPVLRDARKSPFDLLLSGPNFGRNTTAAFALSSGTIGGALEGAVCGVRAVALSFAFFTRQETVAMIEEASTLSVRLIERLCRDWEASDMANGNGLPQSTQDVPDLYSINVPLVEGISQKPIHWTWMLPNQVYHGSLYKSIKPEETSEGETSPVPPSFRWSPNFAEVWKSVDDSADGNDGRIIREKCVSVTPLKANFQSLFGVGAFQGHVKI